MSVPTENRRYAIEKMTNALGVLATHPGDVRKRLVDAFYILQTLRETDFPESLRDEWRALQRNFIRCPPVYRADGEILIGAIDASMRSIKNRTGSKIATQLYELYWKLSANERYL